MTWLNKKRASIFSVLTVFVVTLLSGAIVYNMQRRAAAEAVIQAVKSLTMGSSSAAEFESKTNAYRRYASKQEITVDGKPTVVIRFLIPGGWRTHALLGASADFTDDRLVSRSVGLAREDCCSVSVDQSLLKDKLGAFEHSNVMRRTTGSSNHIAFDISPAITPSEFDHFAAFSLNCLSPFTQCGSTDKLNAATEEMITASDRAGN